MIVGFFICISGSFHTGVEHNVVAKKLPPTEGSVLCLCHDLGSHVISHETVYWEGQGLSENSRIQIKCLIPSEIGGIVASSCFSDKVGANSCVPDCVKLHQVEIFVEF